LLGAYFKRLGILFKIEWMKIVIKRKASKSKKRAFTDSERDKVLELTKGEKGWKYYLPRIALLTGCCLNEIAQLRVSDVVTIGNQPHLSINANGDDKRLKREASERDIPLSKSFYMLIKPLIKDKPVNDRLFMDIPYSIDNGYNSKPRKYFSKMQHE
jgi:integrase